MMKLTDTQAEIFLKEQKGGNSLKQLWEQVKREDNEPTHEKPGVFKTIKDRLNRIVRRRRNNDLYEVNKQLVVLEKYRARILKMAHDIPFGVHLGIKKTKARIQEKLYWPNMGKEIKAYCQSCQVCQLTGKANDKTKGFIQSVPIVTIPFDKMGIDIKGPISKVTKDGNKYILTAKDYATRYPEAVSLKDLQAKTVADGLLNIFARVGFPKEIISDLGTSFMSQLVKELFKGCGIKHRNTTKYHPQSNGLVENFNKTLKQLIKMYAHKNPNDWDKQLQHLFFAYREVPQESTGYSPFELLFGRKVKGPMDILSATWTGEEEIREGDVIDYVENLRSHIDLVQDAALKNLEAAQWKQKESWG
uniref:Gypsy retrotransposon integrase-like protein 1 n=1 Tax=Anolis carolinensis TaxID=28377 RepID=A0A803U0E4_ANOCA